jgi:hypothetical protein
MICPIGADNLRYGVLTITRLTPWCNGSIIKSDYLFAVCLVSAFAAQTTSARQHLSHHLCTSYPTFLNSLPSWISVGGGGYFNFGNSESSLIRAAGGSAARTGLPAGLACWHGGVRIHFGSCSPSLRSCSSSVARISCLDISGFLWKLSRDNRRFRPL